MFLTPGYKRLSIDVKTAVTGHMTHTETIKVGAELSNIHFDTPLVMKPDVAYNCSLRIGAGTDINGRFSVEVNGEQETTLDVIGGTLEWFYKQLKRSTIESASYYYFILLVKF